MAMYTETHSPSRRNHLARRLPPSSLAPGKMEHLAYAGLTHDPARDLIREHRTAHPVEAW